MNLSDLLEGQKAVIVKVKGTGAFRKRVTEMGFVKGKLITMIKKAPLADPLEFRILDYDISLRRSEAQAIEVLDVSESSEDLTQYQSFNGIIDDEYISDKFINKGKNIDIALIGNPNCGKTTIFNHASGSREHVGNYGGVTVDAKTATYKFKDYTLNLIDLPGTYSLSAYTRKVN